jgi:hypothetical protein
VEHPADGDPTRLELEVHRVEQERRVDGVRLQDRSRRRVPVGLDRRVEHADRHLVRAPAVREIERRHDDARELVLGHLGDVGGRQAAREHTRERGDGVGAIPGDPAGRQVREALQRRPIDGGLGLVRRAHT